VIAQQAAFADAMLRAAVAAAQDERDEMQVYLAHARPIAESLTLAGVERTWPLPQRLAEGELWAEVDRFAEARTALTAVSGGPYAGRAALALGRMLERTGEPAAACRAYRQAEAATLSDAAAARAREALARLSCQEH
jgi:hypothetical protein